MSVVAYLALGGGAGGIILGALVWYYRREATRATADRDAAVAGLAAAQTASAAELARRQASIGALHVADERYQTAVEEWIRGGHPELEPEYLGLCVRLVAAASAGDAAVPVPAAPAAGPVAK